MLNIGVGIACIILSEIQAKKTGFDIAVFIAGIINIAIGVVRYA